MVLGIWLIILPLVVIGLILIWQGWRGVPELSEPSCRQCGYDVRGLSWMEPGRLCPECGADLSAPRAVRFGRFRRRPRRMAIGATIMALAFLLPAGLIVTLNYLHSRKQATESNGAIIARLATTADQPWDWQKLEARYAAGRMSTAEVGQAIDQLIVHIQGNPTRKRSTLPWADKFFGMALNNKEMSSEQLGRLFEAFYGPSPPVRMRSRVRQGRKVQFSLQSTGGWDLPKTKSVVALRAVTVDGKALEVAPKHTASPNMNFMSATTHQYISGEIRPPADVGKHEIRFEFDVGLLLENAKLDPRFNGHPGQADRWPSPLVKLTQTARLPLEVVAADAAVVGLITDPRLDPTPVISVLPVEVTRQGNAVVARTTVTVGDVQVPYYFRILAEVDGKPQDWGPIQGNVHTGSISLRTGKDTGPLPPSLKAVRIVLQPDAASAEENTDLYEIWGKPVTFENVPLERYDLEETPGAPSPASTQSTEVKGERP